MYVRGGDHGSNRPADAPNPAGFTVQPKVQVWSVATAGSAPKLLGEGDDPAIAPDGTRVAFVRDRRIWIAPIDGSEAAGSGVLRPRQQRVAGVVARRPDARVRLQPRRSQLHRPVHARSADPLSRAVHVARFGAGLVSRWTQDRVPAAARHRRRPAIAARPDQDEVGDPRGPTRSSSERAR